MRSQASGDARLVVEAQANIGAMHYFRGDYEKAYDWFSRAAASAEQRGLAIEAEILSQRLGMPVVPTVARLGMTARVYGSGIVVDQIPAAGTPVERGARSTLRLEQQIAGEAPPGLHGGAALGQ